MKPPTLLISVFATYLCLFECDYTIYCTTTKTTNMPPVNLTSRKIQYAICEQINVSRKKKKFYLQNVHV